MSAGAYGHLRDTFLTLAPSPGVRAAWEWIFANVYEYTNTTPIQPFRAVESTHKSKRFIVFEVLPDNGQGTEQPFPLTIRSFDGQHSTSTRLSTAGELADYVVSALFTHTNRGAYLAFIGGSRYALHLVLRFAAGESTNRGYQFHPFCRGTTITLLVVRRGHHSWTLTDPACMIGQNVAVQTVSCTTGATDQSAPLPAPGAVHRTLTALNALSMARFGTPLAASLGSTAVGAAQRCIPPDSWIWRPSAFAVTLCRAARGYGGGYVYGSSYHGPAWQVDVNKMYTWAMGQPLPLRIAPYYPASGGPERDGLFLCEVFGPGRYPINVARFVSSASGFARGNWQGSYCLAVLATAEIAGIRRLGYRVVPGGGIDFLRTFDFAPLAATIEAISAEYGRGSVEERFAKAIGNAVYGKLGSNPRATEIVYAATRPTGGYLPFCDEQGDEVEGVWVRQQDKYRAYQHVDIAAIITARARGRLYEAMAATADAGGRVLAANTDCLIVDRLWSGSTLDDPDAVGAWRLQAFDEHATVAGRNAYVVGKDVHLAGVKEPEPAFLEALQRGETIRARGRRLQTPWLSETMYLETLSAISRADPPGSSEPAQSSVLDALSSGS